MVVMDGVCPYSFSIKRKNKPCKECSFFRDRGYWPKLIAQDIFGVQPMTGPTGLIFHLKYTYDGKEVKVNDDKSDLPVK